MDGAELGLAVSVFLACAVECVEALTIVLAVGSSRSWRWSLLGVAAALVVLAAIVLALGAGLGSLPLDTLRVTVGVLLLVFGLQWLRKAVLRQAGRKALRDETEAYRRAELDASEAAAPPQDRGWDGYAFAISAKAVLLEGLEVALIVVTFGAARHRVGLAAVAAALAASTVVLVGIAVRRPLARVPENSMKFAVGVMLSAYGVFWLAEGAGLRWPGGEAMLIALLAAVLGCSALAVAVLRRRAPGVLLGDR